MPNLTYLTFASVPHLRLYVVEPKNSDSIVFSSGTSSK